MSVCLRTSADSAFEEDPVLQDEIQPVELTEQQQTLSAILVPKEEQNGATKKTALSNGSSAKTPSAAQSRLARLAAPKTIPVKSTRPATAPTPTVPASARSLAAAKTVGTFKKSSITTPRGALTSTTNKLSTTSPLPAVSSISKEKENNPGLMSASRKTSVSTVTTTATTKPIIGAAVAPKKSVNLPVTARRMSQQPTRTTTIATSTTKLAPKMSLTSATKRAEPTANRFPRTALSETVNNTSAMAKSRKSITGDANNASAALSAASARAWENRCHGLKKNLQDRFMSIEALAITVQWLMSREQRLNNHLLAARNEIQNKITLLEKTRKFADAEFSRIAARAEEAAQETERLQQEQIQLAELHQQELEEMTKRQERKLNHVFEQYESDRLKYQEAHDKEMQTLRLENEQHLEKLKTDHKAELRKLEEDLENRGSHQLQERNAKLELEIFELQNSLLRLKNDYERVKLEADHSLLVDSVMVDSMDNNPPEPCASEHAFSLDPEISSSSQDSAFSPEMTGVMVEPANNTQPVIRLRQPTQQDPSVRLRSCKSLCIRSRDVICSESGLPSEAASEIESLKVVLELRLEELSILRRQIMEQEIQVAQLKELKSQLRNEEHRVEELTIMLRQKVESERTETLQIEELKSANVNLVKELKDKGLALESFQYKYLQAESRVADMMDFINSNGLSYDPETMAITQKTPTPTSMMPQRPNTAHGCRGLPVTNLNPDERPLSPVRPFPLDQFGAVLSPPTPRGSRKKSPLVERDTEDDWFPQETSSTKDCL